MLLAICVSLTLSCQPPPAPAAPPPGAPPAYRFVPHTDRFVGFSRADTLYVGQLDVNGDFSRLFAFPVPAEGVFIYRGPGYDLLFETKSAAQLKLVYEYRSGVLIPGRITLNGNFVPDPNGRMMEFQHYRYSSTAPLIWNLPGRFEPVVPPKP